MAKSYKKKLNFIRKKLKLGKIRQKSLAVPPSDLKLLKLTGCLQDAWSSVACFGDDYHTISEARAVPGGALMSEMTCSRCVNCVFIDFSLFWLVFMKIIEKLGKSAKPNEKSMETQLIH